MRFLLLAIALLAPLLAQTIVQGPQVAPLNVGMAPNTISGLQLWLTVDSHSGKTNGQSVSSWSDSSTNSRSVTHSGTAKTYRTSGINGKPSVEFGASGGFSCAFSLAGTDDITMFAVYRKTNSAAIQYIYEYGTDGYSNPGEFHLYVETLAQLYRSTGTGPNRSSQYSGATPTNGIIHVATSDLTLAINEAQTYVNGTTIGSWVENQNSGGNFANQTLHIGTRTGGVTPFAGYISEIGAYNRKLTADEITGLRAYLNAKYALY